MGADHTYPGIRKENAPQFCPLWKSNHVFVLANFITLDILHSIAQRCNAAVTAQWSIPNGHYVVPPCSTRHRWALLSVYLVRRSKEGVHADIVLCCHSDNIRVTQRQRFLSQLVQNQDGVLIRTSDSFTSRQMCPPVSSCGPCLMWSVENGSRTAVGRAVGEQRPMLIYTQSALALANKQKFKTPTQTCPIIQIWIRKVKVTMKFSIIEFHSNCVMRLLINSPDTPCQV